MSTRHSIKGVIKNGSGKPVADAIVMIREGSDTFHDMASVSNEKGEFYVSGITIPGNYVLQIEHVNGTVHKEIDIHSADQVVTVII